MSRHDSVDHAARQVDVEAKTVKVGGGGLKLILECFRILCAGRPTPALVDELKAIHSEHKDFPLLLREPVELDDL